jgi:hypothetical protein
MAVARHREGRALELGFEGLEFAAARNPACNELIEGCQQHIRIEREFGQPPPADTIVIGAVVHDPLLSLRADNPK